MDRSIIFSLIIIILLGVSYYFWQEHQASLVLLETDSSVEIRKEQKVTEENVEILYPVPVVSDTQIEAREENAEAALVANEFIIPELNNSDAIIKEALVEIHELENLLRVFIFRDFIRHIVVTIDNVTAKKLPRRFVFTQSPNESFMVETSEEEKIFILKESNYSRYNIYLNFVNNVSNEQLVSIYIKFYPLFQEAYDELGYSGRYFNDRLVEVIDHLLETPEVYKQIKLVRPKVFYQFLDDELENLSSGQKILIRIGSENSKQLKVRLKTIKKLLTSFTRAQ
jgi:hypothetical protein